MYKNNLVLNLKELSPQKWRLFLEFLDSPYFNKHKGVVLLANYLYQCQKEVEAKTIDRHSVFAACFPSEPYRLQRLKDLFSRLQKKFRHFVSTQFFQEQDEWQQSALVRGASIMNLNTLWQQQNKQFKQAGFSSYHTFELLELEKSDILKQRDRSRSQKVIEQQIGWLEGYFWKERFRLAIEHISLTKVLNIEVEDQNFEVLKNLPSSVKNDKTISRYNLTFQMLQLDYPQSEPAFLGLLASIEENDFSGSTADESYEFYLYALNYCTARINSGDSTYYEYIFTIYKLLDLHERLVQNGVLFQETYLNIVATACNLKKFDWAASFIQNYHQYIPASQRKSAFAYNLALLHFYQHEYDEALASLQQISFTDPYYALTARILEMRIFFEKQEWLVLDALFERFRIYLLRNRDLPKRRKLESQHFLKLAKTLSYLTQQGRIEEIQHEKVVQLLKEIEESKRLMHRAWLQEKGKDLLKK